jgi:hypothetical protein
MSVCKEDIAAMIILNLKIESSMQSELFLHKWLQMKSLNLIQNQSNWYSVHYGQVSDNLNRKQVL